MYIEQMERNAREKDEEVGRESWKKKTKSVCAEQNGTRGCDKGGSWRFDKDLTDFMFFSHWWATEKINWQLGDVVVWVSPCALQTLFTAANSFPYDYQMVVYGIKCI